MPIDAEAPSAVAIRDAHVVTISGADLPKATVLLRGGLIQDVGPALAIPADVSVIDGTGLNVYPGFIDGLSTWGIAPPTSAPAASGQSINTVAAPAKVIHGPEDRPQTYAFERAADLVSPTDRRLETSPRRGIYQRSNIS